MRTRYPITPTQGPPIRSISPAARTPNSPLSCANIYHGLSSHLGLDVSSSITHTSEI
uniref:Uncharacterized protein n=1 Tax=Mesocestoides corti TaxID=53468 RepID=A0A5K3ETS6_MESCO